MLMNNNEYLDLVQTIKQEIQQAQYKATLSVNKELIMLYYNIGKIINGVCTNSVVAQCCNFG